MAAPSIGWVRARWRKAAICSRETGSVGQKLLSLGGLHPNVIHAVRRRFTSVSCTDASSSTNQSRSPPVDSPRARTRNDAICSLVTGWSGQKRSLAGGLQPRAIPAWAILSISASKIDVSSSTNQLLSTGVGR